MQWNKEQILKESEKAFQQFTTYCNSLPDDVFFYQPTGKWSIAQNVQHLITSVKTTTAVYALPKFLVRLVGGKPNRPSINYDQLVEKYKSVLDKGGKASGRYIPKSIKSSTGKQALLATWSKASAAYLQALQKNWTNEQLDHYAAPHPLLKKITLRELCYFTCYHTYHHLNIIKSRIS